MYEIWLAMNIAWEIALTAWPWLVALALLAIVLWTVALQRAPRWRAGLGGTLVVGVLAAVATVLTLPMWSQSSLAELAYAPDWAALLGIAAGVAGVAMLLAWPLLAGLQRRQPE
ncbi:MAG: hypothetical protein ABS84_14325 [Rubrivivax sp. SCN 71-131]|jgi:hypothetical protein|nr:MAG: hypothetical protein ABS84_14325 [Rubrivivax sp. SCN 71-131]